MCWGKVDQVPGLKSDRSLNDVHVLSIFSENVIFSYEDDCFFGPIGKALSGEWPTTAKIKVKVKNTVPIFTFYSKNLLNKSKLYVPRKLISAVMHMAHDSKITGHLKFAKTMVMFDQSHWKQKTLYIKIQIDEFIV